MALGAWGRFRAHLSAASAQRCHQISYPGEPGISNQAPFLITDYRPLIPEMVGSGRNRTSCPKGLRLRRSDGTSLSLMALPDARNQESDVSNQMD
jgi:hypothetical protein